MKGLKECLSNFKFTEEIEKFLFATIIVVLVKVGVPSPCLKLLLLVKICLFHLRVIRSETFGL